MRIVPYIPFKDEIEQDSATKLDNDYSAIAYEDLLPKFGRTQEFFIQTAANPSYNPHRPMGVASPKEFDQEIDEASDDKEDKEFGSAVKE